jgi:hypothetical protein
MELEDKRIMMDAFSIAIIHTSQNLECMDHVNVLVSKTNRTPERRTASKRSRQLYCGNEAVSALELVVAAAPASEEVRGIAALCCLAMAIHN